jgi:hypothetical protein
MADNSGQVSVPGVPSELIEWIRRQAEAELTSKAQIMRKLLVAAWKVERDRGERAA